MAMKFLSTYIFLFLITSLNGFSQTNFDDLTWPREIKTEKATVTLYQPQLEIFEGNNLEARMAVSISHKDEMIFGAVWIKSLVSTDLDDREVILESVSITKTSFPEIDDESKIEKFSDLLANEMDGWDMVMSLDRLIASMNGLDETKGSSAKLNNNPPVIYFRTSPTHLISTDGEPIYKELDEFKLEYVVNTPFFIVKEGGKYYIKDGKFWYMSSTFSSDYSKIDIAPKNVQGFADKYGGDIELDSFQLAQTKAPDLIIATEPSELIWTNGEPDYKSIEGTGLLYVANTTDDIIMDIDSQEHYILISGRWYYSKNLNDGDWKFSEPEDLPKDFPNIPDDGDLANVRSSIPNTPEAQDALLEQSIPQTAKIDRKEATVEVTYDGEPQFEAIEGTSMSYAINTEKTILLIDKKYYCIDDAIWFVSNKAKGPWEVSVERPEEVDQIPPESPVYNVKYAHIYDSTPETVYVGYYPGYTNSYVYNGTVVYGTGYHYPYWYGSYYYPRPVTFGFGVHYNPYSGWGFSFGIHIGWGFHPYGCWGAAGFHYGYRGGYNNGYRRGYAHGYNQGSRSNGANMARNRNNVYADRNNGVKETGNVNRTRPTDKGNMNKAQASSKQNNMYANKDGQVYQQKKDGSFENKSNANKAQGNDRSGASSREGASKAQANNRTSPSSRENTNKTPSRSQSSNQQLNQASQNRSRGTQNYNRSNQSRSGGGASRGGGGASRGGGGGRRR